MNSYEKSVAEMKKEKEIRKKELTVAIQLVNKIRDIDSVRKNAHWDSMLNKIHNDMRISLGAILVEQELKKTK